MLGLNADCVPGWKTIWFLLDLILASCLMLLALNSVTVHVHILCVTVVKALDVLRYT